MEEITSSEPVSGTDRKKSIIKLIIFISVLILLIVLLKLTGVDSYLDKDKLQLWIKGFGPMGPLVYILLYATAPSLFLPGLPLTVAAGLAFGPFYGSIFAIIGATIGASIAFLVARYFARKQIEGLVKGRLKSIYDGVESQGWIYVAITRLIPLFPFNLLNYAFGLTKIKFSHYVITSFICMLPATVAYVVFSSSILDLLKGQVSPELLIGAALIVGISLIPLVYKRFKTRG